MRSEANHKAYMESVRGDGKSVARVVKWLRSRGDDAVYLPKTYAKRQEDVAKHADNGDIRGRLRSFGSDIDRIYGVKERKTLNFTCQADFPWRDLTVCKKSVWDHADPKPRAFFNLNRLWTHVGVIWSSTWEFWTARGFTDNRPDRGETEILYVCPIHLVDFYDIRESEDG